LTTRSESDGPEGTGTPSDRRVVLRVVWFGLIALVVYGLLPTLAEFPADARDLTDIDWWALALGLVFSAVAQLAVIVLFQRSLRTLGAEPAPPPGILTRVWMAESTLAALLPGGSVAGALVSVDVLRGRGVEPEKTTTAIVLTKLLWWIALLAIAVVGLVLSLGHEQASNGYITMAAIVIPFLSIGAGALVFGVLRPSRVVPVVRRLAVTASRYRSAIDADSVSARADEILTAARPMLLRWAFVVNGSLAVAVWAANVIVLELMLRSLGERPGVGIAVLAVAIAQIVAVIPITPGGVGVVEIVMVSILTGFGMVSGVAVIAVIAYRIISYWLPLLVGGLTYLSIRGMRHQVHTAQDD